MLSSVHVMGSYWSDGSDQRSPLGTLVSEAKDLGNPVALERLRRQLSEFVAALDLGADPLVLAVPPGPHRDAHPVPALASSVASALGVAPGDVLDRAHDAPRLRGTPMEGRRRAVEAAGYVVTGDVAGRSVVLVDDVILTGTTLGFLAELLRDAGAAEINAVVACRTRLATGPGAAG
jgi:predicted amidophosphoribosyltransferase